MSKIESKVKKPGRAVRGEWGRGTGWKKVKGQRTEMHDPWTWTTMWGFTMGTGGRLGGGEQKGKNWDNSYSINN